MVGTSVWTILRTCAGRAAVGLAMLGALAQTSVSPALAQADEALGVRWTELEGGGYWAGTWTRRGSTGIFDASWNGGIVTATLTISISGNTATIARRDASDGNDCDYTGTVTGSEVKGTYTCSNGGPFEWSATIEQGFSGGPRTVTDAEVMLNCGDRIAAQEELVVSAQAALGALESLRIYKAALDEAYQANVESALADRFVDATVMLAGWPIGSAIEKRLREEVKQTLTDKLLKAGLKGIEKRLLKDPTLAGVFEQLTSSAGRLQGVEFDLTKQTMKDSLNKLLGENNGGDMIMGAVDLITLGYKTYQGMKVVEAYRLHARAVNDQILLMDQAFARRVAITERADAAIAQCLASLQNNQPPDPNEFNWAEVQAYVAAPHGMGQ